MTGSEEQRLKGSEARLWGLIEARSRPGADVAGLDRRIWDLFGEDWAVMFTDLSGFSRSVERFGILHFLQVIHEAKKRLLPIVADHDGILLKVEADSFLILFRRAQRALACADALQRACAQYNRNRAAEDHLLLCVGLGYGRILRLGDADAYGQEVNAASKLGEDTARAWEVLATEGFRKALEDPAGWSFTEGPPVSGAPSTWKVQPAVGPWG